MMAANLGALEVAVLARQLEALGDSGTTSGAAPLLPRLGTALDRARAGIRSYRERWLASTS